MPSRKASAAILILAISVGVGLLLGVVLGLVILAL